MHQKLQSYDVRFLRFFVTFSHFLPFHSPDDPENQNFEQLKKTPGDIIILHMCIINDNHIMYCSRHMERDQQEFFVILDRFLPFYPPNDPQNQNFIKTKLTPGDIFYKCVPKY